MCLRMGNCWTGWYWQTDLSPVAFCALEISGLLLGVLLERVFESNLRYLRQSQRAVNWTQSGAVGRSGCGLWRKGTDSVFGFLWLLRYFVSFGYITIWMSDLKWIFGRENYFSLLLASPRNRWGKVWSWALSQGQEGCWRGSLATGAVCLEEINASLWK